MYYLTLYYPGDPIPKQRREVLWAADVLKAIPEMLSEHDGCEYIAVSLDGTKMFAVDCKGNRLPD